MKKVILIIAAMEDIELNYLKNRINNLKKIEYKGIKFFEGEFFDKRLVLCESGIGLINATFSATIAIEKYNPNFIINEGLAGGYTKDIKTKEIVIGTDAINISSMECKGNGSILENYEITTFLHNEKNRLVIQKANNNIIELIRKQLKKENIHYGTIASGDIWNKDKERITYLNKKYGALCEDMEAISIYTVANLYNIPVVRN